MFAVLQRCCLNISPVLAENDDQSLRKRTGILKRQNTVHSGLKMQAKSKF